MVNAKKDGKSFQDAMRAHTHKQTKNTQRRMIIPSKMYNCWTESRKNSWGKNTNYRHEK